MCLRSWLLFLRLSSDGFLSQPLFLYLPLTGCACVSVYPWVLSSCVSSSLSQVLSSQVLSSQVFSRKSFPHKSFVSSPLSQVLGFKSFPLKSFPRSFSLSFSGSLSVSLFVCLSVSGYGRHVCGGTCLSSLPLFLCPFCVCVSLCASVCGYSISTTCVWCSIVWCSCSVSVSLIAHCISMHLVSSSV